jgi:3-hydroxyisobutyrate dehydrogenase
MAKIGWLGLGTMGFPMAGNLSQRGDHEITVYNRTPSKTDKWISQHGGRAADSPAEASAEADYVIACVGNDDDLREVTLGPAGAFSAMKVGAVFVDHTTTSASIARELFLAAKGAGIEFLDAPVSGGQSGAEKGTLTVMCGGSPEIFDRVEDVMAAYSRTRKLLGDAGSGQLAKMCNQIAIAGLVEALAEAIHFGKTVGLNMLDVIEVISKGAAGSWQMDNRSATIIAEEYSFGFAVDWMRKDLAICLDEARRSGARLPVTALVDQFYSEVQALGGGRWDTSSLAARLGT